MKNARTVRSLSVAVVAAAALTLSACGGGEAAPADDSAPAQTEDSGAQEPVPSEDAGASTDSGSSMSSSDARGGDLEDARAAVETAEAENGGTAHSLDFDDDGAWEIDVISGDVEWEYDISTDGSSVDRADEDDDVDSDDRSELETAEVSLIEALEIAHEDTPGTIDDIDLDEDDGTLRWDVSIFAEGSNDDTEVHVDAVSGEVTQDTDDDETERD